ncbi:protein of unknown function [Chitinophaga jiangningensis]|uniref:DUF4194 domain-containing protein n=1 Tax=Chitinophaga jiangningensis TaxID=1419482 RepID=A0A1M6YCE8_9BACT|nr:DUF4194 domain-containing protein [Chitinophaga jiangningensis]SHL15783.1 protein of unknown function [Chitinophaga jiangningensis]
MQEYSLSLISLLKGLVFNHQQEVWGNMITYESDVRKYFTHLGLEVYIDKSEGFAFLRQIAFEEDVMTLPKLIEKRQLNFFTTLICIVLRKYLLEHDAQGGSVRSIISEAEIVNRTKVFLPVVNDEAKQQEKIVTTINKIVDIGFLRKLDDQENNYEVHRIIKGFINADVIDATLKSLQEYIQNKSSKE